MAVRADDGRQGLGLFRGLAAAVSIAGIGAIASPESALAVTPTGNCAVLALSGGAVIMNGRADGIGGDVCIAPTSALLAFGLQGMGGAVRLAPGARLVPPNGVAAALVRTNQDLSADIGSVLAAAAEADGLACTQNFARLEGNTTVNGNGGLNVVCVEDIVVRSDETLTLIGGPNDRFVLNISGRMTVDGGRIVADGMAPAAVLYDVRGRGGRVTLGGSGGRSSCASRRIDGNVVAPQRNVMLRRAQVNGMIASGRFVRIVSGPDPHCPVVLSPRMAATSCPNGAAGALCNAPNVAGCTGATALVPASSTHYALRTGATVVAKILAATDLTGRERCNNGRPGVNVIVKSTVLGNTTICGTMSGCPGAACSITFTYTAPANACATTNVAYANTGNGATSDVVDDGLRNSSTCTASGFAFVNAAGVPVTCNSPTTTTLASTTTSTSSSTTTTTTTVTTTTTTTATPTTTTTTATTTTVTTTTTTTAPPTTTTITTTTTTDAPTSTTTTTEPRVAVCGNNEVEEGEACDPPGSACPASDGGPDGLCTEECTCVFFSGS